eukprot:Gb_07740 [translate_table: standard]
MGEDRQDSIVYRISTEAEWKSLQQTEATLGGDLDKQTGCIHLSKQSQVKDVLHNFFPGREDLYLLKVDTTKLGEGLIYESADGLNFFPHFYGPSRIFAPLALGAIIEAEKVELIDGKFVLPF